MTAVSPKLRLLESKTREKDEVFYRFLMQGKNPELHRWNPPCIATIMA
jgi:hypothetical protein